MRAVIPAGKSDRHPGRVQTPAGNSDRQPGQVQAPAGGVCFHLRLPRGILKKCYWLRFCMAKGTDSGSHESPAPSFRQVVRSITTQAVILTLLLIVLAETIFILYLVKCLFGFDFFPDFHLFS
jgi:hypothetical protein